MFCKAVVVESILLNNSEVDVRFDEGFVRDSRRRIVLQF